MEIPLLGAARTIPSLDRSSSPASSPSLACHIIALFALGESATTFERLAADLEGARESPNRLGEMAGFLASCRHRRSHCTHTSERLAGTA
jgi:hypothetical protein